MINRMISSGMAIYVNPLVEAARRAAKTGTTDPSDAKIIEQQVKESIAAADRRIEKRYTEKIRVIDE